MNQLVQDIRYAMRGMRKSPGFAIIAILTLALGVGVATAIFSVIDAVILRPLPYNQPDRIVVPMTIAAQGYTQPPSWLSYLDMRRQNHVFSALAGYMDYTSINLRAASGPVALRLVAGTDNFFDVFGVRPILGRTYLPGEDQPGRNNVAVLSYEVWKTHFDGDPNVVGRTIDLDGKPYTCIGVMPASFNFSGIEHAIYAPIQLPPQWAGNRGSHWLQTVGRLKPGVTRQQALADMDQVLNDLARAYPDTDAGRKVQIIPIKEYVNGEASGGLWTLAGAALAVLAIGCVNLAGLLLARGVKREREIALRAAIGAGRARLVRQLLTENLLLAACGCAAATGAAWFLLAAMRAVLVRALSRGAEVHLNGTVLLVALALSMLTSMAASLAPALRLSGTSPNLALKTGGSAGTAASQYRLRSIFIISQVALSLALLAVASVLLRSITEFRNANLGFDPHHILTAEIDLSPGRYEGRNAWADFYEPMLERVSHLPGVQGAGIISSVPIRTSGVNEEVHIAGQPPYPPNAVTLAEVRIVSPGYFDAMGIQRLQGRNLSPSIDLPTNKAQAVVVNQAFVKKFIPKGLDPVGQHLDDNDQASAKTEIVGVVANVRQNLMGPSLPEMDWLYTELPAADRSQYLLSTNLMVRTQGDPKKLIPDLRDIFHDLDPTLPLRAPETMDDVISNQLVMQRLEGRLFSIFAGLAVLLAIVGLYGLISHEVELRAQDIGIRMALGASRQAVLVMVLRRVAILLAAGVVAGGLLTAATRKLIASVVILNFSDQAGLLAAVAILLALAGMLAALYPARRAASIDPMQALRTE